MSKERNNSRFVPLDDTDKLVIHFTKASPENLKCMLAFSSTLKPVDSKLVKKFVRCEPGTEADFKRKIEDNLFEISSDLAGRLKASYPTIYDECYAQKPSGCLLTFGQYYEDVHENIEHLNCWADSTIGQYDANVTNQLNKHINGKPMRDLTFYDYYVAMLEVYNSRDKGLSESRVDQLIWNLAYVSKYAYINKVCDTDPFAGQNLDFGKKVNLTRKIIDGQLSKKCLNTSENACSAALIAETVFNEHENIGSALMAFAGLRTAEVCGPNFGDLKPFGLTPERYYLPIVSQNRDTPRINGEKLTNILKTKNAYRFIPIDKRLQVLIDEEREYLLSLDYSSEEIKEMPLAFKRKKKRGKEASKPPLKGDFERCTPKDVRTVGKRILTQTLGKQSVLKVPEESEMNIDGSIPSGKVTTAKPIESDPQAYQYRRNFDTLLFSVCEMEYREVQFVIGHMLEWGNSTDYTNEDVLLALLHKMDRIISIPDHYAKDKNELCKKMSSPDPRKVVHEITCNDNETIEIPLEKEVGLRYLVKPFSEDQFLEISISLNAREPSDKITVCIYAEGGITGTAFVSNAKKCVPEKTTTILSYYYDDLFCEMDFDKNKPKTEIINNDEVDDHDVEADDEITKRYEADEITDFDSENDDSDEENDE